APTDASSTAPDVRPSTLAHEVAELSEVKRTLASGDASAALAMLHAYERKHPHAVLGMEAAVLRVDALALRGDNPAASRAAQDLLRRFPNGPHADHLRKFVRTDER